VLHHLLAEQPVGDAGVGFEGRAALRHLAARQPESTQCGQQQANRDAWHEAQSLPAVQRPEWRSFGGAHAADSGTGHWAGQCNRSVTAPAATAPGHRKARARLRGGEEFGRDRAAHQKVSDLGAKHSHSPGYGEHLQRRAGAFWCDERA
jgi:hypothetical protein